MLNELQTLIKLQEIDSRLYELERSKGDLPGRVQELDDRIKQLTADRQRKVDELAAVSGERRSTEGALQMLHERRKKFESQLFAVTSNREYDAVTVEIESADQEIDSRETRVLELIDREQGLSQEIAAAAQQLAVVQKEHDEQRAILDAQMADMRVQVEDLQKRRQEHTALLKPQMLNNYSRILRGKDGVAVVQMVRGACSGCNTRIPPQRAMEIREMDKIILCESCGRILVPSTGGEASVQGQT